ncbi:MAG: S8 family serine peptidase [candidate division WOR-3 bacterium]
MSKAGLVAVGYVAYQALVCRASRRIRGGLAAVPGAVRAARFRPEYKLAPELSASLDAPLELVASVWPGEDSSAVAAAFAGLGAAVDFQSGSIIGLHATARAALELARLEAVAWIEQRSRCEPFNSDVQWVVQTGWYPEPPEPESGRRFWTNGIRGQGIVLGLIDMGINVWHDMFRDPAMPLTGPGVFPDHRKIAAYKLYRTAAFGDAPAAGYHGTAVAGTLAGSDNPVGGSSPFDGVAPDARIYFVDNGTASGYYVYYDEMAELLDSIRYSLGMPEPVRQASGSFGSLDGLGYYRLAEATADAVCWEEKELMVTWAAGNAGGTRYRLGHPSCAKNLLTVGGTGNGVASNEIYPASSRGPTRDGRIKPNIVAPGQNVNTAYGADTAVYSLRSGTSFSAPAAAAVLGLARQYFREGRYPDGMPDSSRSLTGLSSAFYRALAIAAADSNIGTAIVPNEAVGWGRLNLSRALHFPGDSVAMTFVDEHHGLGTGTYHEFLLDIDRRSPLRVVLAWTDTAAAPEAAITIVNDLNLEIISPDQNCYRGNQLYEGQSMGNPPTWDERNVEEVCLLEHPLTGRWRIRVYGRNIYTVRQPYALVITGGIVGLPPGITEPALPSGSARSAARCWPLVPPGATLRVFGADGRLRLTAANSTPTPQRPALTELNSGTWFYRVDSPTGTAATGKLVLVR